MRISVIAPDRTIVVDGVSIRFAGLPPDSSVSTLQYDTDAAMGSIAFDNMQVEPITDPAPVRPWLDRWHAELLALAEQAQRAVSVAADLAATRATEAEKARIEAAQREAEAAEQAALAAATAAAEQNLIIENKVRAVLAEMAKAG